MVFSLPSRWPVRQFWAQDDALSAHCLSSCVHFWHKRKVFKDTERTATDPKMATRTGKVSDFLSISVLFVPVKKRRKSTIKFIFDSKYYDYQLSKARRRVGDHALTLKLCCCHGQLSWLRLQWQLVDLWRHWQQSARNCRRRYCYRLKRVRLRLATPLFKGQNVVTETLSLLVQLLIVVFDDVHESFLEIWKKQPW